MYKWHIAPFSLACNRGAGGYTGVEILDSSIRKDSNMAIENNPARIGKTIVVRGEVKGAEDLIIDGRVEGTVQLGDNRLTIGPSANVAADLVAKDVLVLGQVQGNITATGRVELRAGCLVEGDLRALRLAIEDNAGFHGKVDLTQGPPKPAGAAPEPVAAAQASLGI